MIPIEKLCRLTSPKGSIISQWYNTYIIARPQNDYLAEYMGRLDKNLKNECLARISNYVPLKKIQDEFQPNIDPRYDH